MAGTVLKCAGGNMAGRYSGKTVATPGTSRGWARGLGKLLTPPGSPRVIGSHELWTSASEADAEKDKPRQQ